MSDDNDGVRGHSGHVEIDDMAWFEPLGSSLGTGDLMDVYEWTKSVLRGETPAMWFRAEPGISLGLRVIGVTGKGRALRGVYVIDVRTGGGETSTWMMQWRDADHLDIVLRDEKRDYAHFEWRRDDTAFEHVAGPYDDQNMALGHKVAWWLGSALKPIDAFIESLDLGPKDLSTLDLREFELEVRPWKGRKGTTR